MHRALPPPYRGHGGHYGYHRHRRPVERLQLDPCPAPWESSRRQPEGSWITGKDQPEPSRDELENLRERNAIPAKSHSQLETNEAFGLAYQALDDVNITRVPCLDREKRRVYKARFLPLMVFNELDKLLFRSVLKGNVFLTLATLPPGIYARTSRPGLHDRPRISIELSPSILGERRNYVLGTLLHQMIHAYLLQCCGFRSEGVTSKGHDLRHGADFEALSQTIRQHFLPGENALWIAEMEPKKPSQLYNRYPRPMPGISSCYCPKKKIDKTKAEQWRMSALALTYSKDAVRQAHDSRFQQYHFLPNNGFQAMQGPVQQYTYPNDHYLKLCFRGEIFTVERPHNSYLEAILKSPCFENGLLNFPSPFGWEEFKNLHQFLSINDYAPNRHDTLQHTAARSNATSHLASISTYSLPYISDTTGSNPNSPPYLLNSISSYHLAKHLMFEPLVSTALQRMNTLPFTYEDPIVLLENIYCSRTMPTPAADLRLWVKRWLSLQFPGGPLFEEYARSYASNLGVLELNPGYSHRLNALKGMSHHLTQDVAEVDRDLAVKFSRDERSHVPGTQWDAHPGTSGVPNPAATTTSWGAATGNWQQGAGSSTAPSSTYGGGMPHLADRFAQARL